jgi:hypothetical protein
MQMSEQRFREIAIFLLRVLSELGPGARERDRRGKRV